MKAINRNSKINLPSNEEIINGINELLLEDKWDRYKIKRSPQKFIKRLDDLFTSKIKMSPLFFISFMNSTGFPFKFYRLRKDEAKFNPNLISEYFHPPAEVINYTQRANLPNHPVFYCSDNAFTAVAETVKFKDEVNPKDIFYLSEWELKPNNDLRFTPYLFDNLNPDSFYNFWVKDNYYKLERTLKREGLENSIDSFKKLLNFLAKLFIYEDTYVISSYIAHNHLYAPHSLRTDILVYPSVQLDKWSVNYAIHPNVVSEKMRLNKVFKMKFVKIDKTNGVTYKLISIAENKDSILFWNNDLESKKDLINETFPGFFDNETP